MKRFLRTLAAAVAAGHALAAPAALDLAGLARDVDPCTDFYAYVNKRWIESTEIPADRSTWSTGAIVAEGNEKVLLGLLDAALRKPLPPAGSPQRKVVEYYGSGMDEAAIRAAGTRPLRPYLDAAAKVGDAASLAQLLGTLHAREIGLGFDFDVSPDRKDSSRYIAELSQGGLGLPDRDYYLVDDERTKKIRDAYRVHVEKMLAVEGDAAAAKRNADAILALETELARASMSAVDRRDVDKTYHRMTLARLEESAPGFPWQRYLEALGAARIGEFNVQQPAFMTRFARLAAERPAADWQAYARWHILRATASKLDPRYADLHFDFSERTLLGKKEPPPRGRHVLQIMSGRFGEQPLAEGIGRLFVQDRFPPEAKARALELVQNVKAALADRLATVDWMSEETRARSLEKLAAMRIKIGYPDEWKDISAAEVGGDRVFVENWLAANHFGHRRDVTRVGGPVDRDEWFMSPHILNAYYSGSNNEIVFPAGILQPPFFDPKADDALNYGGIGMVIGHEITHGFDNRGRRYDKDGNLRDWWTPEDERRYTERAAKIERQYAAYKGIDGANVNGKLTLGENISDIGGMKIAYLALRKALAAHPQGPIDGLTPDQRFFLSFAQIWRSEYRDEQERLQMRTGQHSLPRFRVKGPLAHMPEFARAFSCSPQATMLPAAERADIW